MIHTHTLSRIPLDERSARRRDSYLTTHKTQETDSHVPGGIRTRNPKTLDRAAAGSRSKTSCW